jgi:hypothetical protein
MGLHVYRGLNTQRSRRKHPLRRKTRMCDETTRVSWSKHKAGGGNTQHDEKHEREMGLHIQQ